MTGSLRRPSACFAGRRCAAGPGRARGSALRERRGFTLIELTVVLAVVAILAAIAYPSYERQVIKGSRTAAQSQLVELANLQEKIFLNDNNYTASVKGNYTGHAGNTAATTNGLGIPGLQTSDGRYSLSLDIAVPSTAYTLTATAIGTSQTKDVYSAITINSSGKRTLVKPDSTTDPW